MHEKVDIHLAHACVPDGKDGSSRLSEISGGRPRKDQARGDPQHPSLCLRWAAAASEEKVEEEEKDSAGGIFPGQEDDGQTVKARVERQDSTQDT